LDHPSEYLHWQTPPDSLITYWLADHVIRLDAASVRPVSEIWSVRLQTDAHPDALWMARPADIQALARAMLPEWNRLVAAQRLLSAWQFDIHVGAGVIALDYDGERLMLRATDSPAASAVHFSPEVFTKLLFGFRPLRWASAQPDQHFSDVAQRLVPVLFPPRVGWVPATDQF
jgi:hypothetical protein